MSNINLENTILEAMDIIASKKINQASFDKTIQATIVSCIDASIGKYKIKYQDGFFFAFSNNIDITYSNGSSVYVLVPNGDMTKDKTILGTTKKLGIDYATVVEEQNGFAPVGNNVIQTSNEWALSSYKTETKELYNYSSNENEIEINLGEIEEYIKNSSYISIGAYVENHLKIQQQYQGNFGIIFGLDFIDNSSQNEVTRYYTIDVDNMSGNPYKLLNKTKQYGVFEIDGENFVRIHSISIFSKDFPVQDDNSQINDIIFSNIQLTGANVLSSNELDGCALVLLTPKGYIFNQNDLDTDNRTIKAQLRVKGKIVDNEIQDIPFYWFIQNMTINSRSQKYNKYGGQGWECLNDYNIIQEEIQADGSTPATPAIVQFTPGKDNISVLKSQSIAYKTKYKCVAVYNNIILSKEVAILNYDSDYDIEIASDNGTEFYYDIGNPTLTCYCRRKQNEDFVDIDPNDLVYVWSSVNNIGNFESLVNSDEYNEDYENLLIIKNGIENLLNTEYILHKQIVDVSTIVSGGVSDSTTINNLFSKYNIEVDQNTTYDLLLQGESSLSSLESYFNNLQRIQDNKIIHVSIKNITSFKTFKCSVFTKVGNIFLGTASITLSNTLQSEKMYSLIINNGSQVFKYNTHGVSPASKQNIVPLQIPALSFTVYDNLGNPIDDDIIKYADITWRVPKQDTLLTISNMYQEVQDFDSAYRTYKNLMSFSYGIAERYNINRKNNNIQLKINYNGLTLVASTDLTFTKEGQEGTNGTDFMCRIIPNVLSGAIPENPTIFYNGSNVSFNWNTDTQNNVWFKAELWHNGNEPIYQGSESAQSTEGKTVTVVQWEVLKNVYGYEVEDKSNLVVSSDVNKVNWHFGFNAGTAFNSSYNQSNYTSWRPANIIKVTLKYDGYTYYATLPVIVCRTWMTSTYRVGLADNSGFRKVLYSSSGINPEYNNQNPFEIKVEQKVGQFWEDVSTKTSNTYSIKYEWFYMGSVWNKINRVWEENYETTLNSSNVGNSSKKWLMRSNLYSNALLKNQKMIKPVEEYTGQCVTTGLACRVYKESNSTTIAWIHIPIHMSINRFFNSAINGWDGNSVELGGANGGTILAPQVGAGIKDNNNRFTGVFMGTAKDPQYSENENVTGLSSSYEDIGLFGYNEGQRTIFLDAKTGKSVFGKNGAGQIIMDPSSDQAIIKSGNYDGQTSGMQINLTAPSIDFGSGNFEVDSDGKLFSRHGRFEGLIVGDVGSTHYGQTLPEALDDVQSYVNNELNVFIEGAVSSILGQADSKIETWYQSTRPDEDNHWTAAQQAEHTGDLWYNSNTGSTYKWNGSSWIRQNAPIQVFDTQDGRMQIFVAQPSVPYNVRDLWIKDSEGKILECQTSKTSSQSYNSNDWEVISEYIDDSPLNTFIYGTYNTNLANVRGQIDQKIETWYQNFDPADLNGPNQWTASEKLEHVGDLWYNSNALIQKYYRWNGSAWEELTANPPTEVFNKINGKTSIFYGSPDAPSGTYEGVEEGDYLVDPSTGTTYRWQVNGTSGTWEIATDYNTAISNVRMSWRNLLRKTANFSDEDVVGTANKFSVQTPGILTIEADSYVKYKVNYLDYAEYNNGYYTFSFDAKEDAAGSGTAGASNTLVYVGYSTTSRVNALFNQSYDRYAKCTDGFALSSNWKRYSFIVQVPDDLTLGKAAALTEGSQLCVEIGRKASSRTATFRNFKLERGNNTVTDWMPAPEDTELAIQHLQQLLEDQIDSQMQTWVQESDPSSNWTTTDLRNIHNGDLWYYTGVTTETSPIYTNNTTYQYNAANNIWVEYSAPGDLFDKIDGKTTIYYGTTSETYQDAQPGDYLVDSTTGTSYRWTGSNWLTVSDYTSAIEKFQPEIIIGSHGSVATDSWTGTSTKITTLEIGTTIKYKITSLGINGASLSLTLKGSNIPITKTIYYKENTPLIDQYPINTVVTLIYDGIAWYVLNPYDNNISVTLDNEYQAISANADGTITSFPSGVVSNVQVFYGTTDVTNMATSSVSVTGLSGTPSNNNKTYTVSGFNNGYDEGSVTFTVTYNGGTASKTFNVAKVKNGATGVGISNKSVEYQKGTSGTTAPTGTWQNSIPSVGEGEYLWTKTTITYTDGSSTEAYSVSRNATNGTNGTNGTSPTVTSTVIKYQQSDSGTSVPTGTWQNNPPTATADKYMWTQTTVTYSDNATAVSYSVAKNGATGTDARIYILDVNTTTISLNKTNALSPSSYTVSSYYRDGNSTRANYSGRFIIQITQNGSSWTTVYTSSSNEQTKTLTLAYSSTATAYSLSGTTLTLPKDIKGLKATLYVAGGTTSKLDEQTTVIVTDGVDGTNGVNNATVYLYQRAAADAQLSPPSGNLTYRFSDKSIISGTLGSWSQSIPSGPNPTWMTIATANSTGTTDTISSTEWTTPVRIDGKDGTPGGNGSNGLNQATIFLYKRASASSTPSTPSGSDMSYTFSSGTLSNIPTGWSRDIPAVDAQNNPCYVSSAAAISSEASVLVTGWSTPVKMVENGTDGRGVSGITGHYLATSASSGVTTSTSGWDESTQLTSSNKYLWYYEVTEFDDGSSSDPTNPIIIGVYGLRGEAGKSISSVTPLYYCYNASTVPSIPTSTQFPNGVTTNDSTVYGQWNKAVPAYTPTNKYYYSCTEILYDDGSYGWSTPVVDNALQSASENAYLANDKIDNLEVGGRNLYAVCNQVDGYLASAATSMSNASSTNKERTSDWIPVEPGSSITIQCWVPSLASTSSQTWIGYAFYTGKDLSTNVSTRPSKYGDAGDTYLAYVDVTVPATANYLRVSYRQFEDGYVKVERSNKASDWTPAPEDLQDAIDLVNTSFASLGGRNLLRNSATFTASDMTLARATVPETGILKLTPTTTATYAKFNVNYLTYGELKSLPLTLSFDAIAVAEGTYSGTTPVLRAYFMLQKAERYANGWDASYDRYTYKATTHTVTSTTEWQRFSTTLPSLDLTNLESGLAGYEVADSDVVSVWFYNTAKKEPAKIRNVKLEVGNAATVYTQAPEDTDALINTALKQSGEFIVGTQTAATRWWTGVSSQISELTDGLQVTYWLPYAYVASAPDTTVTPPETGTSNLSNCWLNLTLKDGTQTGFIRCFYGGTTRITSHYAALNAIHLTYRSHVSSTDTYPGWYADANYNANTNYYDRMLHNANIKAVTKINKNHLIAGTSDGYKNIAANLAFDLSYPILWASADIAAAASAKTAYEIYQDVNFSSNGTGCLESGTANKMVYLKGTVSGNTFTISAVPFLTTVIPTTADNEYYIPLGVMTSATNGYFTTSNRLFAYINGAFQAVDTASQMLASDAQLAAAAADSKANNALDEISITNENIDQLQQTVNNNQIANTNAINNLQEDAISKYNELKAYADSILNGYKEEVAQYMKFDASTGLTMGATVNGTESTFKTVLDNQSLKFYEDNTPVAWVAAKQLNIKDAVIEDNLLIGNFFFTERTDGGVSLIWQNTNS